MFGKSLHVFVAGSHAMALVLMAKLTSPTVSTAYGKYESEPPETIISVPVQTAVWPPRADGALVVLVGVQVPGPQGEFPSVMRGRV
jgi:hypothetical protein